MSGSSFVSADKTYDQLSLLKKKMVFLGSLILPWFELFKIS